MTSSRFQRTLSLISLVLVASGLEAGSKFHAFSAGQRVARTVQEPQAMESAAMYLLNSRITMGLGEDHGLKTLNTLTDNSGQTHVRFQQHYKGVKV